MIWVNALNALLAEVLEDGAFVDALDGEHLYRDGEHSAPQRRAVYYSVLANTEEENTEPVLSQWDIYAPDMETALAIEARLRAKLHWNGWKDVGGVWLSSRYEDSRDHPEPEFDVIHRSLDFRHEPANRS